MPVVAAIQEAEQENLLNLGGGGCREPRSRLCTPAWVTEQGSVTHTHTHTHTHTQVCMHARLLKRGDLPLLAQCHSCLGTRLPGQTRGAIKVRELAFLTRAESDNHPEFFY